MRSILLIWAVKCSLGPNPLAVRWMRWGALVRSTNRLLMEVKYTDKKLTCWSSGEASCPRTKHSQSLVNNVATFFYFSCSMEWMAEEGEEDPRRTPSFAEKNGYFSATILIASLIWRENRPRHAAAWMSCRPIYICYIRDNQTWLMHHGKFHEKEVKPALTLPVLSLCAVQAWTRPRQSRGHFQFISIHPLKDVSGSTVNKARKWAVGVTCVGC